jgi:hypothetical protein
MDRIPQSVRTFFRNLFFLVVGLVGVWLLVMIFNKFLPLPAWLGVFLSILYVLPIIYFVTRYVPYPKAVSVVVLTIAIIAASFAAYDLYTAQDPLLAQDAAQGQRARWNLLGRLIGSTQANQVAVDRHYQNEADSVIAAKKSADRQKCLDQYTQDSDIEAYRRCNDAVTNKYKITKPDGTDLVQLKTVNYSSGSSWISKPAAFVPCFGLPILQKQVTVSADGLTATVVVPQGYRKGVRTKGFSIKKGQKFRLETSNAPTAMFSSDHPCVGAWGMAGWHDPHVDSPFKDNVGGLEFAICDLKLNRDLAVNHLALLPAQASGEFIFRAIDRPGGSKGKYGGHIVVIHKIP